MDSPATTPTCATPQNDKGESMTKKSLFTPCRRLGLKRKSSSALNTPGSDKIVTPNSVFKNHKLSFDTPRKIAPVPFPKTRLETTPDLKADTLLWENSDKQPVLAISDHVKVEDKSENVLPKLEYIPEDDISKYAESPTEEILQALRKSVLCKEKQLKDLKQVLLKKKAQGLNSLEHRTKIWLTGCHDALRQLHNKTQSMGHQLTMSEMITQLRIPFDLIQFDPESEDFIET